ncbi:MAG: ribosomal-processing cysteine protease Prp [Ruminococcus sp.]|nr:ribosomal-processing cysteine protease Prp [Ruminococcus sp.]
MIRAEFYESKGILTGFRMSGHSGYAESGSDIVCAAVSSAVQLTANTMEAFGCKIKVAVDDSAVKCVAEEADENAVRLVDSLLLHIKAISEDYPKTIKIITTEV